MKAKIGLGVVAALLLAFGLVASGGLFAPPPTGAQSAPDAPRSGALLVRFTTPVVPVFETGAMGQPVELMIEIRGDGPALRGIPVGAWQENLPGKVKTALEEALTRAVDAPPSADRRPDQILERLDGIERRLKQLEHKLSPAGGQ
jgi:hypothetical protein